MKIEEIRKQFESGTQIIRHKPLRMSSGDTYSINDQRISYKQVRKLEEFYNTKEVYSSVMQNIITFISKKNV